MYSQEHRIDVLNHNMGLHLLKLVPSCVRNTRHKVDLRKKKEKRKDVHA